jgi:hypothetical protein
MISTQQLLYKIDMKLNKLASVEHQSIPLEDKILALNEAQIKLIKKKIDYNNNYQLGLDAFKKRYEDLQILVYPNQESIDQFEKATVTKTTDKVYDTYQVDITKLQKQYMLPLDMYAICSKGDCTERPVFLNKVIKHGDISTLMANNHYVPSFEYEESFVVISGNSIMIYTDGTFTVDNLYITYLRYPKKIDSAGYINFDGTDSINQDSELPDYLEDELLDLAVLELAMSTENTPVVQYDQIRNKNNE